MKFEKPAVCQHLYGTFIAHYDGQAFIKYETSPSRNHGDMTDVFPYCPRCGKQLKRKGSK